MEKLTYLDRVMQAPLFEMLEERLGSLTERQVQFIQILEVINIEAFISAREPGVGRPKAYRQEMARAFVAKALFQIPTTDMLIDRLLSDKTFRNLCGFMSAWEVPDKTVFSRAFAEFTKINLPERIHTTLIDTVYTDRLVLHICRDATEIEAREHAARKPESSSIDPAPKEKKSKKRGRPKKDEVRPEKEKTRIERQTSMTFEEMIADLPQDCDFGSKKNSKGKVENWCGYKLHIDCADGGVPISCILTSASVHDSQVAIPLSMMTAERVVNCYDVMDAGYSSQIIREHSESLGHVAIIDHNPRRGQKKIEFDPATAIRYNVRSTIERVNARLKDEFGGRLIWVKGHRKVFTHLMFGILVLTARQLMQCLT